MSVEQIREFISAPSMPDIVAYASIIILLILQSFIKRFVRKDGVQTLFAVDQKTARVDKLKEELNRQIETAANERKLYEQEREKLKEEISSISNEFELIKGTIRLGFGNVESLVKSGYANKIAKLLAPKEQEIIKEPTEETEGEKGV